MEVGADLKIERIDYSPVLGPASRQSSRKVTINVMECQHETIPRERVYYKYNNLLLDRYEGMQAQQSTPRSISCAIQW